MSLIVYSFALFMINMSMVYIHYVRGLVVLTYERDNDDFKLSHNVVIALRALVPKHF